MFNLSNQDEAALQCTWTGTDMAPHERIFVEFFETGEDEEPQFTGRVRIDVDAVDPEDLEQLAAILNGAARYWRASSAYVLGHTNIKPSLHMLNNPHLYDQDGNLCSDSANGT